MLWFDVGIKRYTTASSAAALNIELWFDVGIKRYTTSGDSNLCMNRCGLMQESKDIQLGYERLRNRHGCGLMQESKDIQRRKDCHPPAVVVV